MNKPVHTPGPWIVVLKENGCPSHIAAPNGSSGPGGITHVTRISGITMPGSAQGRANARLMAEAPALLAVARWLVLGDDAGPIERHRMRQAAMECLKRLDQG